MKNNSIKVNVCGRGRFIEMVTKTIGAYCPRFGRGVRDILDRYEANRSGPCGVQFRSNGLGCVVAWWNDEWVVRAMSWPVAKEKIEEYFGNRLVSEVPPFAAAHLVNWYEYERKYLDGIRARIDPDERKLRLWRTTEWWGEIAWERVDLGIEVWRIQYFSTYDLVCLGAVVWVVAPSRRAACRGIGRVLELDWNPAVDEVLQRWGMTEEGVRGLLEMGESEARAAIEFSR